MVIIQFIRCLNDTICYSRYFKLVMKTVETVQGTNTKHQTPLMVLDNVVQTCEGTTRLIMFKVIFCFALSLICSKWQTANGKTVRAFKVSLGIHHVKSISNRPKTSLHKYYSHCVLMTKC